MKEYGIPTFGQKQNAVIRSLERIKLLKILKARAYNDYITERPMVMLVMVKTIYPVAKILTYLFSHNMITDDICTNNLRKMERLAETDEGVRKLLDYSRSINGVFG